MELKGKKIIITGGLGFIGSNLVEKCLKIGMDVTIYDNLDPRSGGNLYNIAPFEKEVDLILGDIINYDHLVQVVINKDIIINCAASTSHPFSMREPWLNLDVNGRGVINILESIRRVNKEIKFVHVGTTTQLGPLHYQPADEQHPEFPTDIYSANKMVAEKYVLLYAKAYNLNASVIRLPNIFGPRAAIHSSDFTFNNYFIGLALQKKSITVYKPGTQLRNVLYVNDAVDALIAACSVDNLAGETFFAVGDEHYSIKEIAEKTCEVMGGNVEIVEWPLSKKAIEFGDAIVSNKKIKKTIRWIPKVDFIEGLKKTREYYTPVLNKYITK